MPTYDELYELKTNCTAIYTGNSFMLTGPNGNSIFLPIGYSYDGMTVGGWISTIWSSMLDLDNPSNAWCLSFDDYGCNMNSSSRYYGRCVQPVYVSTRN